jgi:glycosyltransferase involved in cell wall biosynthesis
VSDSSLVVRLESPLPSTLSGTAAEAVFLYGSCFHPRDRITRLSLVAGAARHRPAAWGMPRAELFGIAGERSFLSGFWGTVPIPAGMRGSVELAVAARLAGGGEQVAPLGRIEVAAERRHVPALQAGGARIAICMATFEPDEALFATQLESLRAQTERDWVCVISDDCSAPERFERVATLVGDDPRFALSRSERRLGFYRNFERALRMAPREAELFALCDQDDRWYPEKLATLRSALGSAQMVYSDQRLVDAGGRVLRDTLWQGRSNNHTDLPSMLVANTVTGASALFRREVAELALPFPEMPGMPFHDHWLALVALAAGEIAYVDRPLYDYVQHRGAFFGSVTHGAEPEEGLSRFRFEGRAAYFRGYVPRALLAQVLLVRCGHGMAARKQRVLRRFVAAERSPLAFAWLAARPARALWGRNETLGSEAQLAVGILWRWALGAAARRARRPRRGLPDARMPGVLSFQQRRLRRWRARV